MRTSLAVPDSLRDRECELGAQGEVIMANRNERHIVPNPKGGWDVKKPDAERASAHTGTQAQAEQRAKEILANQGGGEAVIHGRDGKIRDSDTVKPGNDPSPPTDMKH